MASAVIKVRNFWFHKIGQAPLAFQQGIYREAGNPARRDGEELA